MTSLYGLGLEPSIFSDGCCIVNGTFSDNKFDTCDRVSPELRLESIFLMVSTAVTEFLFSRDKDLDFVLTPDVPSSVIDTLTVDESFDLYWVCFKTFSRESLRPNSLASDAEFLFPYLDIAWSSICLSLSLILLSIDIRLLTEDLLDVEVSTACRDCSIWVMFDTNALLLVESVVHFPDVPLPVNEIRLLGLKDVVLGLLGLRESILF